MVDSFQEGLFRQLHCYVLRPTIILKYTSFYQEDYSNRPKSEHVRILDVRSTFRFKLLRTENNAKIRKNLFGFRTFEIRTSLFERSDFVQLI